MERNLSVNLAIKTRESPKVDLQWLTVMRFLAASWVVVHHFGPGFSPTWRFGAFAASSFLERGSAGVGFFFVLSGFILAHAYSDGFAVKSFLVKRFARLYPVHVLALLVSIPALLLEVSEHVSHHGELAGTAISVAKAGMVLGLLQAWWPSSALFWNGVSWSLSAEMFFYLSFPFLLPRIRKLGDGSVLAVAAGSLFVSVLLGWAGSLRPHIVWGFLPLFRIPEFILGVAAQVLVSRGKGPRPAVAPAALAGFVVLQFLSFPDPVVSALRSGVSLVCIALLVTALGSSRTWVPKGRSMDFLVLLGNASYSVYLLQFPVMYWWERCGGGKGVASRIGYFAVLVAVSIAVYRWYESKMRDAICRAWASGRGRPNAPGVR